MTSNYIGTNLVQLYISTLNYKSKRVSQIIVTVQIILIFAIPHNVFILTAKYWGWGGGVGGGVHYITYTHI
jgi:hypothetical protein